MPTGYKIYFALRGNTTSERLLKIFRHKGLYGLDRKLNPSIHIAHDIRLYRSKGTIPLYGYEPSKYTVKAYKTAKCAPAFFN